MMKSLLFSAHPAADLMKHRNQDIVRNIDEGSAVETA